MFEKQQGVLLIIMAIKNIDDKQYEELYSSIDRDFFIRLFQAVKYRTIVPILCSASVNSHVLDVGCAKGAFLHFLLKQGFKNLSGLDLKNTLYPQLRNSVTFYQASIADPNLELATQFNAVTVSCMLHHLSAGELDVVARNVAKCLKPGGRLYIYEPNIVSLVGKLFYFYFLRLWPSLYKATIRENEEQIAFCKAWPTFINTLESLGITTEKLSGKLFYLAFVGIKKKDENN